MPAQYAAAGSYAGMQMAQMQQPYGQQQAPYVAAPKQQQVMPNPGPATQQRPAGPQAWSTSMWACCDDWFICCITNGSPSIMYGENYRKLHGSGFCSACCLYYWCSCFACCFANTTRANIRAKYNLPEEPCGDCCVHYFCSPCALCQEARELRKREGWQTWVD
uniref:Uncharacterized protein n=1 Tax=Chlamydomonas leiostraca TaxID=1034604 RepID=A0A7S0WF14_9CHLO